MALKCNRFSSFFAHAYNYICIIIIYVTRPVSIVCYKKHNPFFPQEFETEHWKEMKAKLQEAILKLSVVAQVNCDVYGSII